MASPEEAQKAIAELNGKDLDGRQITVSEAKPREPRENQGGGGNYRRDDRRNDRRGGNNY